MKKDTLLIMITISIIALIVLFRKPINKGVQMAKSTLSRGYRNNNPGNIRLTFKNGKPEYWKGEIPGTDTAFKTFSSMLFGYRAIFVTLTSYLNKGFNTIEKIINRYAPSNENHTVSYINTVVSRTGIPANKELSFSNPDELMRVVQAISFVENGIAANPEDVKAGYNLFKS